MNGNAAKRHLAAELARRHARGESRTDLARVRAKTAAELERDIAGDLDFRDIPKDWVATANAELVMARLR